MVKSIGEELVGQHDSGNSGTFIQERCLFRLSPVCLEPPLFIRLASSVKCRSYAPPLTCNNDIASHYLLVQSSARWFVGPRLHKPDHLGVNRAEGVALATFAETTESSESVNTSE